MEPELMVCATGTFCTSTKCSTVVQVPWLPEVTKGHVTPKDVEGCAHAHAYTLPPLQGLRDLRSLLVAMVLVLLI
jgi:hypothetical protein